jgi:hypothetical protein
MYTKDDWLQAMHEADEASWDEIDIREGYGPLVLAMWTAYDSGKVGADEYVLAAAVVAAHSRYGSEWDIQQFEAVWSNYVENVDGWEAVAEHYLDDNYPGLVTTHGKHMDLHEIGREYARDRESEQYITIPDDGQVYIFNKRN